MIDLHVYSKTGIYRDIPIFRILDSKHRLWVVLTCIHNQCFEPTPCNYLEHFLLRFFIFYKFKNPCILHGQVSVMYWAQLFKTNDVVSKRFVKISNINITNTLLFFVEKM